MTPAFDPAEYRRVYAGFSDQNPMWNAIPAGGEAILRLELHARRERRAPEAGRHGRRRR